MDTIKEIQDEQAKGIHSLFNACMYKGECRAMNARLKQAEKIIETVAEGCSWGEFKELYDEFVKGDEVTPNEQGQPGRADE